MVDITSNNILQSLKWIYVDFEEKSNHQTEIFYFSLSTCVYCKRGIQWLKDRQCSFRWLYLDEYPVEKRHEIKAWIQEKYKLKSRMASPFVIFRQKNQDFISNGYDPDYWKSKAK